VTVGGAAIQGAVPALAMAKVAFPIIAFVAETVLTEGLGAAYDHKADMADTFSKKITGQPSVSARDKSRVVERKARNFSRTQLAR
jgi:hypothetical protein